MVFQRETCAFFSKASFPAGLPVITIGIRSELLNNVL